MIGIQVLIHPSNNTFYLRRTKNGFFPPKLTKNKYFQIEKKALEQKSEEFDQFLIDFAEENKIEFYENFYRDLFISWGLEFIHKNYIPSQSILLKKYFIKLFNYTTRSNDYHPVILSNSHTLDHFDSKLSLDIESLNINSKLASKLNQFRLMYLLCLCNMIDINIAKKMTWNNLLNKDYFDLNLVRLPLIKRVRVVLNRLYRLKGSPPKSARIFSEKFDRRFPTLFNGLMFFYGYSLRIDQSEKTMQRLGAIYLIQKKGFSIELHSFLMKIIGYDIIEEMDTIFDNHLSYSIDNYKRRIFEDEFFNENILKLYNPQ